MLLLHKQKCLKFIVSELLDYYTEIMLALYSCGLGHPVWCAWNNTLDLLLGFNTHFLTIHRYSSQLKESRLM